MLFLWRPFRGLREKEHPSEEPKACETEKRLNRDDGQARTLLLALCELKRKMDPLIATQVYNNRLCPLISRLPEELLLCILDFMRDDFAALLCLRMTSRISFRLLYSERIYLWGSSTCFLKGEAFDLSRSSKLQFRRLLQRDGRCNSCKRWNDAHAQVLDDCKFQQTDRGTGSRSRLHCNACDSYHDFLQFSQGSLWPQSKRYCLGQQGVVQLCAHVSISWASIKAHIDDWRQNQRGGDWQACLDSFKMECHDPSHDTRCMGSKAPTRPQARLVTSTRNPDIVVLNLEWEPHGCLATLPVTADGRIPAQELRGLFQRIRSCGPAATLYPSSHSGALPEMAFFSPALRTSQLVHYKTGEDDPPGQAPELSRSFCLPSPLSWDFRHGFGRNGTKLDIALHGPSDAISTTISSQCLVIRYEKDIMVCTTKALTDLSLKINPTDHWLHAMDTGSYTHPQGNSVRPQCKDVACVNYYQKRKDSYDCPTHFDANQ